MEETRRRLNTVSMVPRQSKLLVIKIAGNDSFLMFIDARTIPGFSRRVGSYANYESFLNGVDEFCVIFYNQYFKGRLLVTPSGFYVYGFHGRLYWKRIENFDVFDEIFQEICRDLLNELDNFQEVNEFPTDKLTKLQERFERLRDPTFQMEIILKLKTFCFVDEPKWSNDSMLLQFENVLFDFRTKWFIHPLPNLLINSSCGFYFDWNVVFDAPYPYGNLTPEVLCAIATIKEFIVAGWKFISNDNTNLREIHLNLKQFRNYAKLFSTPLYRHAMCMLMIWHFDELYEMIHNGTFKRFIFKYKSLLQILTATELHPENEI